MLTLDASPCVTILIFLLGLGFLGAGVYVLRESLRFRRHGVITVGQVIATHKGYGRRGIHPIIRFTEPLRGMTIESTEKSGISPLPKRYSVGREVRIRYLPSDPQQAQIVWIWNSPLTGLLIMALGVFVWWLLIAFR